MAPGIRLGSVNVNKLMSEQCFQHQKAESNNEGNKWGYYSIYEVYHEQEYIAR